MNREGGARDLGVKVRRALDALGHLDTVAARKELGELAKRYPSNAYYAAALTFVEQIDSTAPGLDERVAAHLRGAPEARRASASAEEGVEHAELPELCCRAVALGLAERAERERGPAAEAGGVPVARLYVEARDSARARAAAESALRAGGESAGLVACLADSFALDDDPLAKAEARDLYRKALVLDPHAVDLTLVVDSDVRDLRSLAETEYEVPGDPVGWLATVGYLERVLPIAHFDEGDFARLGEDGLLDVPAVPEGAQAFYHYMRVSESHQFFGDRGDAIRLEARKRLKTICAAMYAKYLERF
jgi:hypothetical protein